MKSTKKLLAMAACLFVLCAGAQAQIPSVPIDNPVSPNADLIGKLTKELNVTPKQAAGGAGAIFGLAKTRLSAADFGKLAAVVPGMDGLLKAAPSVKAESGLGSLGSMLPEGTGGLASLAGSFKSLGLSPEMAAKFVPVLKNYLQSKGGTGIASILSGALK